MSTSVVQVAIVALFALMCGVLVLAWRRGRLGVVSVLLFAVAAVVWALELAALVTQYHDADGFATCSEDCTAVHYVSAIAFLAPPLLISLSAAAMLVAMGRRIILRRNAAREAAS
jgi:hypothetical protein